MQSRFRIFRSMAEVEGVWRDLEPRATASPFQSFRWLEAWSRHVSPVRGEEPLIVVGSDAGGRPSFLLPLATQPAQGTSVLAWLGQEHATYAMGLFDDKCDARLDVAALREILAEVGRANPGISALNLKNQPTSWAGRSNPLAALGAQESANRSYQLRLDADFDNQVARTFKKHARGKLRRATQALAGLPGHALDTGTTVERRLALLDSFFAQKARQLAERGIGNPFQHPQIVAFYRDLAGAGDNRPPLLECMGLVASGQTLATATSISFQDQRHLLTLSLGTEDPLLLKHSPGLALMRHHIGRAAADGISCYDFGAGDGQHKAIWQPDAVPLFDTYLPLSLRGYSVSMAAAGRSFAKRIIKNNERLWQAAQSARRLLKSTRP